MIRIITDYLEESARAYPDKLCFADGSRSLTFGQVREESQKMAQGLINAGFFHKPVAVLLDKSVSCITAMLGAAYSGNYYTVIDTHMPEARIRKMMSTLMPSVILTSEQHRAQALEIARESGNARILLVEDCLKLRVDEAQIERVGERILTTDVLYVLFTSGSTGNPKGVVTPHCAVIQYMEALSKAYGLSDQTVFANQTPFYFVMSIVDIFATLRCGGSMYIVPGLYFTLVPNLMKFIQAHQINTTYWVPSAYNMVARTDMFSAADISCLKKVIFGGEVMPVSVLNAWKRALPDAVFINAYGPTEGTDGSTYYIVDRDFPENASLPIGIPFMNNDILVLDENDQRIEPGRAGAAGKVGEFCIRSSSLTYGYYNEPEKTDEVYVRNPLNPYYEEKIYRTGDLVRYNRYGELEFVGRKDFQIKHMGHRIELGEIETNASGLNGVEENGCIYDTASGKIVLYYTGSIQENEVKKGLRALVPEYMVPNKIFHLEQMPHGLSGKVDRTKLREMYDEPE